MILKKVFGIIFVMLGAVLLIAVSPAVILFALLFGAYHQSVSKLSQFSPNKRWSCHSP